MVDSESEIGDRNPLGKILGLIEGLHLEKSIYGIPSANGLKRCPVQFLPVCPVDIGRTCKYIQGVLPGHSPRIFMEKPAVRLKVYRCFGTSRAHGAMLAP